MTDAVVVTGASGFLGRSLCARLRANGWDVRACEARADEGGVRAAMAGARYAVHAWTRSPWAEATRGECEREVLVPAEVVLEAVRGAGVKRFVYVSSEEVGAGGQVRDYADEREPHAAHFTTPWAEMTAVAEALVSAAHDATRTETVVVRPGWLWGDGDDELLADWVARARAGRLRLAGDGRALVPTAHVTNVVSAIEKALTAPDAAGNTYVATDDERIGAAAFVSRLLATAGVRAPRASVPYGVARVLGALRVAGWTRADVLRFGRGGYFNLERARKDLAWAPEVSIAQGLAAMRGPSG